mmetsp:Transcript_13123/g.30168  ORF Transcript_13123/g.30168 Transcript_13123/m.30168 type:complete len:187 (-) Transcript_13123:121-681(-)
MLERKISMDFEGEESLSELAFAMELEEGAVRSCPLFDLPHTGEDVRFLQASMQNSHSQDHEKEELSDFDIALDNLELDFSQLNSPACFYEDLPHYSEYKSSGDRSPSSVADIASSAGAWTPKIELCEFSVHVQNCVKKHDLGKKGSAAERHNSHAPNLHEFFSQFRGSNAGSTPEASALKFGSLVL